MDFYLDLKCPACRGALLTARAVGVELNRKYMDVNAGDQMKPEFLAINPQHCVPTLVDGDLKLWESRAISAYFVNQYGKDDSLYPKEPKARALVDRMMYFDLGTLYKSMAGYLLPVILQGAPLDPEKLVKVQETLGLFNSMLEGRDYAAGPVCSIADHCLVVTVSSMMAAGIDTSRHPNVTAWVARCKANMPGYDENEKGAQQLWDVIKSKLDEQSKT